MNRRRISQLAALAGVITVGLFAGLAFAPAAFAWSPSSLPAGWSIIHNVNVGAATCGESYTILTAGNAAVSPPFCTDSATYQADFDGWVNAHYTAPVTTTTTPDVTTTVILTTTTDTTTTTTTTAAPSPGPGQPAPTTTSNVVTVTTTANPVEQSLQAQIDALTAQLAALTDRVTRLEKAGDASWLAFEQAVADGAKIPDAAETARGTWLNVVYQLGAFAP